MAESLSQRLPDCSVKAPAGGGERSREEEKVHMAQTAARVLPAITGSPDSGSFSPLEGDAARQHLRQQTLQQLRRWWPEVPACRGTGSAPGDFGKATCHSPEGHQVMSTRVAASAKEEPPAPSTAAPGWRGEPDWGTSA